MARATLLRRFTVPAALLAGAWAVRLIGVDFGLPYAYNWDEPFIAIPVLRFWLEGDWLPHFYCYPSGYIYLQFATAPLSHALYVLGHAETPLTFTDFYLLGRLSTVTFGVTAVALVYYFTRRLTGERWAGVFAAAFLAVSPLHAAGSRYMTTDVPMATTAFAAAFVFTAYLPRRSLRALIGAGVLFGAAIGIKYNAAFFFIPAAVAVAIRERNWARPALFIGAAAAVFFLLNPGIAFERTAFLRDFFLASGHYFFRSDAAGGTFFPWPRFSAHLWSYALTPGPLILAAAGVILLLWKERRKAVYFLMFPASYALFLALIRVTHTRTLQPLLPFAAVLAGYAAAAGARGMRRRLRPYVNGVLVALLCGAVFFKPIYLTGREAVALLAKDNRTVALEWFEVHVPWPQRVVKESGNCAPLDEGGQLDAPPLDTGKYEVRVGPSIIAAGAAEYASAGFTYILAGDLKKDISRATGADPLHAGMYCRNYTSVLENTSLVLSLEARGYGHSFPVHVYRLNDDILRDCHPPCREIMFGRKWVCAEDEPARKMRRLEGRFVLEAPARAAAYFTAPGERFRVAACVERLSGEPRVVIEVDGEEVAARDITAGGAVATPPLAAPPYYRHLAVRCLGPPGSRVRLKSALVEPAL